MVSSTGMTCPIWAWVASLYCRQNSMMFTPCSPRAVATGGAGVACPARIWSCTTARTFLRRRGAGAPFDMLIDLLRSDRPARPASRCGSVSDLRHLIKGQLDRCLPVEDVDKYLELGLLHVDLGDRPGEVGERADDDPHDVTFLPFQAEGRLDLRLFLDGEDLLHLALGQRRRLGSGAAGDEPRHPRGVPHDIPGIVVVDHLDQEVAGEDLSLHHLLLPALDLHDVFHGDDDIEDLVFHLHGTDARMRLRLLAWPGVAPPLRSQRPPRRRWPPRLPPPLRTRTDRDRSPRAAPRPLPPRRLRAARPRPPLRGRWLLRWGRRSRRPPAKAPLRLPPPTRVPLRAPRVRFPGRRLPRAPRRRLRPPPQLEG